MQSPTCHGYHQKQGHNIANGAKPSNDLCRASDWKFAQGFLVGYLLKEPRPPPKPIYLHFTHFLIYKRGSQNHLPTRSRREDYCYMHNHN